MSDLSSWSSRAAQLVPHRIPPAVLITRWALLLGDEESLFFDVAHSAGGDVVGTQYCFLAVTASSVIFMAATHEDEAWEHDAYANDVNQMTPREIISWRRPLRAVAEVRLGDQKAQDWLPNQERAAARRPRIMLVFADGSSIPLPLNSKHRAPGDLPEVAPVIKRLSEVWTPAVLNSSCRGVRRRP